MISMKRFSSTSLRDAGPNRDVTSDYNPLPDSRPPLHYVLFAVGVAALAVLTFVAIFGSCTQ